MDNDNAKGKEAACNALANYFLERLLEERPDAVRDYIRECVAFGRGSLEIEWQK